MKYLALVLIFTQMAEADVDDYINAHEEVCMDSEEPSMCFDYLKELELKQEIEEYHKGTGLTKEEYLETMNSYKKD